MFKMKKILFVVICLLYGVAYGQVCADEDTVRSNAVTLITANTVRVNGTVSHFSGAPTSLQLRYVRVGQTDTATSSSVPTTALRNLTGLQAATQYYYYYKTICGSGSVSQTIGAYTFTTLANTVLYAPERPTVFNHLKVDSSFIVPEGDTVVGREPSTRAQIRYKTSDNTFYGYYTDCTCWRALAIDSSGIIGLLDGKVDSVTVSGDSLFYWKVGVSYGYILPSVATVWHTTGNTGIDTSTDFIGTTDNVDFPIKTNNVRRFTVNTSGALGIGATPDYGTSGYLLKSAGNAAAPAWVDHATLTTPLSNLTAAVATNSINNANYGQTWEWNTLTGTAMTLSANTTASTPGSILLSLSREGANATANRTTYGLVISNQHTGTTSTNYSLLSQASLGVTTYGGRFTSAGTGTAYGVNSSSQGTGSNIAGYFASSGGTSNYAIIVPASSGSVGIGTSAPDSTLHVVGGFKYTNGSQGAGKYLTSDANGGATWGDLSLTASSTTTFTNKRWTARVGSTTSSATPTINTDNYDIYKLTAQTADITSMTTNLSGTPVDGDILEVQITGTAARAITWGASFVSSTVTLPTTTVTTATLTVILQYYSTSSYGNNKWVCVNYY